MTTEAVVDPFEGYEFVPGEVFGTRSFRVDGLGRLTGVSFPSVWRPGVNEATCQSNDLLWDWRRYAPELYERLTGIPAAKSLKEEEERRLVHRGIEPRSSRPPRRSVPIYGFGPKTPPSLVYYTDPFLPSSFDEEVSELDRKLVKSVPHRIEQCRHGFYAYYEGSNDYRTEGSGVSGVIKGFGETTIGTRGFRTMKAEIVALHLDDKVMSMPTQGLIRRNYAGIPIFKTFEAMVGEFPPSSGESKVGPDADPEFWTRSV